MGQNNVFVDKKLFGLKNDFEIEKNAWLKKILVEKYLAVEKIFRLTKFFR